MTSQPTAPSTTRTSPQTLGSPARTYHHAAQQPTWADPDVRDAVCADLAERPALVDVAELRALKAELAAVARGEGLVLQAGDCAESFAECTPEHTRAKADAVQRLADRLADATGARTVPIGRIAGQFGKPRSSDTERVGERELPSFRGHIVNAPEPTDGARRHRAERMLEAYRTSHGAATELRRRASRVWTSHEALVLDYEVPLVRFDDNDAQWYLGSTHLPWIGERTRQSDGAHVRLLADVLNPVACKVSGAAAQDELLRVCNLLDPEREPGRLTLIARFGADRVRDRLPEVARAVRAAGHPVVWLCDPMHGNTYTAVDGHKTRRLSTVQDEVRGFVAALREAGVRPGGLHLEAAADAVTECVGGDVPDEQHLAERYTSLCDPRLNPGQAAAVVDTFTEELA
ncbi:3-deoxy-7-phosphoheptulonate synthase [Streptomyces sp. NPDC038707]|uniref:3-deoxy-7-phosphoheptulonate synthase n=1 Tax=unclassified Streptomyces TaxID=2593676 RepID=UPI0033F9BDC8